MYQKPREAKRLYFDVIPRCVDDYLQFLAAYPQQDVKQRLGNPVWHIHAGEPPPPEMLHHPGESGHGTSITFVMLLNLAAVANTESKDVLWGFLNRYAPDVTPQSHPRLDELIGYALRYYRDFVRPEKTYRRADPVESEALRKLGDALATLPEGASAEAVQTLLYDVARPIPRYQDLKAKGATPQRPGVSNEWFNMIYQVLLGESRGPRFGSFVALYGIAETRGLIDKALSGALLAEHAEFLKGREG